MRKTPRILQVRIGNCGQSPNVRNQIGLNKVGAEGRGRPDQSRGRGDHQQLAPQPAAVAFTIVLHGKLLKAS